MRGSAGAGRPPLPSSAGPPRWRWPSRLGPAFHLPVHAARWRTRVASHSGHKRGTFVATARRPISHGLGVVCPSGGCVLPAGSRGAFGLPRRCYHGKAEAHGRIFPLMSGLVFVDRCCPSVVESRVQIRGPRLCILARRRSQSRRAASVRGVGARPPFSMRPAQTCAAGPPEHWSPAGQLAAFGFTHHDGLVPVGRRIRDSCRCRVEAFAWAFRQQPLNAQRNGADPEREHSLERPAAVGRDSFMIRTARLRHSLCCPDRAQHAIALHMGHARVVVTAGDAAAGVSWQGRIAIIKLKPVAARHADATDCSLQPCGKAP